MHFHMLEYSRRHWVFRARIHDIRNRNGGSLIGNLPFETLGWRSGPRPKRTLRLVGEDFRFVPKAAGGGNWERTLNVGLLVVH